MKPAAHPVRAAQARDLAALPDIERAAATLFPAGALPPAALDPLDTDSLRRALDEGLLWVAHVAGDSAPAGFLAAEALGECLHILEMSVLPAAGGQGLGSHLLEAAAAAARARALRCLSLTTFAHLPWNAPWYQRRGFVAIAPPLAQAGPFAHLGERLAQEQALGFRDRVAMVRPLD